MYEFFYIAKNEINQFNKFIILGELRIGSKNNSAYRQPREPAESFRESLAA